MSRLTALFDAARRIADHTTDLGARARALLPASTGLSPEGVEAALRNSLEHRCTRSDLRALIDRSEAVSRAHVLLSANVFVATLRAIALAVAASDFVDVRSSRREPVMAQLLFEGSEGVFRLVDALAPSPGEHVWAYGSQETLTALRKEMPAGIVLHGHGPGFGAVVIQQRELVEPGPEVWNRLAHDVALFDQRGCLSPRVLLLIGNATWARSCIAALVKELAAVQGSIPLGNLTDDEAADVVRFRDTASYACEIWPAGKGWVSFDDTGDLLLLPPTGRCLHAMRTQDPIGLVKHLRSDLTTVGLLPFDQLAPSFERSFPDTRLAKIGSLQCPPLDGPVDRRPSTRGVLL